MADVDFIHPEIRDAESFRDFHDALADYAPRVEQLLAELRRQPSSNPVIADLFRAFHNIKGDAGLCQIDWVIPLVHGIENILTRLRSNELRFTELQGEVMLLTLDRIEQAVDALEQNRSLAHLRLQDLCDGLESLIDLAEKPLDDAITELIHNITGFKPAAVRLPSRLPSFTMSDGALQEDLAFFRTLALQLEAHSPLYQGRTARNLRLAQDTNREAGLPVDPQQLEAAVYLHDIGMMFLPAEYWLTSAVLDDAHRLRLVEHPSWAAGLLARMPGWSVAAEICLQHHERPGGTGYPNGLPLDRIHPGARILALVDAFESVMLKHSHRGQQRSVLRAISEVNATVDQFDPAWLAPFNRVIRRMLES
ncbi:HD domain-containing phosphohydrolase [Chitinilyticum piscinae]|uniref:HD domain-containing protein n=1 Tax=Chitinilyticum piscinae TaxID=2866724 RepID=A0A8J7K220_9NEIS|nr:HD domain-containing phosphohydrolase [Chitinilyticum piscinae]MBE9609427.1 HD domain-containing protein [Chitinilyticum piscinae]